MAIAKVDTQWLHLLNSAAFSPVVQQSCNAGDAIPFCSAWLSYDTTTAGFPVGFIYQDGLSQLLDVIDKREKDEVVTGAQNRALACIQKYLYEDFEKHTQCLTGMKDIEDEEDLQAVLACHLFGPLGVDSEENISKGGMDEQQPLADRPHSTLRCPSCDEKIVFQNPYFGNEKVWHGQADIFLQKSAILSATTSRLKGLEEPDHADSDSASDSGISRSSSSSHVEEFPYLRTQAVHECMALTITNAFCKVKTCPVPNVFIPCFFATNDKVKVYLYNCKKDGLLESEYMSIMQGNCIDLSTLIITWLAINFDSFQCVDLYSEALSFVCPPSRFPTIVGDRVLKIYEQMESYIAEVTSGTGNEEPRKKVVHGSFYLLNDDAYPRKRHIDSALSIEETMKRRKEDESKK